MRGMSPLTFSEIKIPVLTIHCRTLHAGLPVTSGNKVGMNIWSRQGVVSEDLRGVDIDD